MKIIAIAMQKGGVGKSTLTHSLAVAATSAGVETLVLDMDLQQTSQHWGRRRGEDVMPPVAFTTENDLQRSLERARSAGVDLVIIDTPPARSSEAPAAVEFCDMVLIPCTPTIEAYEQLARTVRLARTYGKAAATVLNIATPNSRSEVETARTVFKDIGVDMAPAVVCRRKIHCEATTRGLAAQEVTPTSHGALEIGALWDWLNARLHLCTPAQLHGCKPARLHGEWSNRP